jgi:flagellar hook-associated protein 1 FlgK
VTDPLNIGTSALLSLQRAISTTGQNIANVNTEGYSRQRVIFEALDPQLRGPGFIGSGVGIAGITRSYDEFLVRDVISRSSSAAAASTLGDLAGRVDNILADPATGLTPALDRFFAAVQDVANNPGSIPERQVLLGEANVLADRFAYLDDRFADLDGEVNVRLEDGVREINGLARSIAQLNDRIVTELGRSGGRPPNDLLDRRDRLIGDLAELVGVTTLEQDDGAINVSIGSGQPLVIGNTANTLAAFRDPRDVSRVNVGLGAFGAQTDITSSITGGQLGAVLSFRGDVLDEARSNLGLIATGIAESFNAQQRLGQDLNGDLGVNFFRPPEPRVIENALNAGAGDVTASISDAVNLTGDQYRLTFDGTTYTLTNTATNASVSSAVPTPTLELEGVSVTVNTAPSANDEFLIDPVGESASLFAVEFTDPRLIAAAAPVRSAALLSNTGSGELDDLRVTGTGSLPLGSAVTLTFAADNGNGVPGFVVGGALTGAIDFNPATDANGLEVTLGDLAFTLRGTPGVNDTFTIANNVDGTGDNRNALALAALQSERTLAGGTASYQDVYAAFVADVAVRTRQAQSTADTEGALLERAISARDSAQGVNLDEEAADLIRFQQAYQAAAQIIAVADEVFQTLLNATSR